MRGKQRRNFIPRLQQGIIYLVALIVIPAVGNATVYPLVDVNPVIDGSFTNSQEYAKANKQRDVQGLGDFYFESKKNWTVNSIEYSNSLTFFVNHYFTDKAFNTLDLWDLNSFRFKYYNPSTNSHETVEVWAFLDGDLQAGQFYDGEWVQAVGLDNSPFYDPGKYSFDDDGGFLVRYNNDPSTDKRWKEGDPRPGDVAWNFADYYGAFASGGFNDSAVSTGMDTHGLVPGDEREIYEFSLTLGPNGIPGGGNNPPPPICVEIWELSIIEVMDWKPEMGGWGTPGGPGWVPKWEHYWDASAHPVVPEPATVVLLGTGLLGLAKLRRGRKA